MTRTLTALAAAATIALASVVTPTTASAQWRHGWHGGGWHGGWRHHGWGPGAVIGGLAAGALIGSALAAPYYGAYAYEPYVGAPCVLRRERIWNGWRWIIRRVEVCY
jgi:hypothetical protein